MGIDKLHRAARAAGFAMVLDDTSIPEARAEAPTARPAVPEPTPRLALPAPKDHVRSAPREPMLRAGWSDWINGLAGRATA